MARFLKFIDYFKEYDLKDYSNCVTATCKKCGLLRTCSNVTLNRHIKGGKQLKCKDCFPPIPRGFSHLGGCKIRCNSCKLTHFNHKRSPNFKCYCRLKSKQKEHQLYKLLQEAGFEVYREVYFDKEESSHKTDLVAKFDNEDGTVGEIFIEVDGIEHFYNTKEHREKDCEFNTMFIENRKENQFLIRVFDDILDDEDVLEELMDYIKFDELYVFAVFFEAGRLKGSPTIKKKFHNLDV